MAILGIGLGIGIGPMAAGGAGPPPAGVLFDADFTTGTYQVNGASAVLSDILVENTDWGNFDPAQDVVPGQGLTTVTGGNPVGTSTFNTIMAADGITLVAVITGAMSPNLDFGIVQLPDYDDGADIHLGPSFIDLSDYAGADVNSPGLSDGTHTLAMNLSRSRLAISADGATVLGLDIAAPTSNTLVFTVPSGVYLETMNGRALVSESELPTLSTP